MTPAEPVDAPAAARDAAAVVPARSVADFTSAARATLERLHARLGMDMWAVSRRDGEDYVVLSALDAGAVGVAAHDVLAWRDTFCAASIAGEAPRFAVQVDDVPGWQHARAATGLPFTSYLTVPMPGPDGELLGTVCAGSRAPVDPAMALQLPDVELAAELLGTLLAYEVRLEQEARRAEQAEDAAEQDALTRLANRRAWDRALEGEESRARRLGLTASVIVLDLDGLKAVNDTGGHIEGDALLVRAADVLRRQFRADDLVARLGGDEFAVLLPGASAAAVVNVIDRLRRSLHDADVHASIGAATRRAATGLVETWRRADAAMYADKATRAAGLRPTRGARGSTPSPDARRSTGSACDGTSAQGQIQRLLDSARRQLGMDAAVLGRFEGDTWAVRHLATRADVPAPHGFTWDRAGTYCQRVLDGRLAPVVPDATANPATRDLEITRALGIGAYVGVPVRLRDGTDYGVLCALSTEAQPELRPRDASVLEILAEALGELVTRDEEQAAERGAVLARLDDLHSAGGPRTVYQPIIELERLQVAGVEALSRFPTGAPDSWFADAARVGASERLELAAVRAALAHRPDTRGFVSINVSPSIAASPALGRALEGQTLDALVLELTEHERVEDYRALLAHLAPLRERGLRIAVDDAGAGFASMRHVLALAPELIKLDMTLIRDVHKDPTRRALAAALTTFARHTGASLVAEGIETAEELDCLRTLGVTHGQGYYLG
ncbi:EAL domain-containing protein, partial [Motilibacter deserti]|nr:EAL domain-containing protein [Motilibacter deserti]